MFESVKAYRQPDGSLAILMLRRHYERLQRSAHLLHIPFEHTCEEFVRSLSELARVLV
jgi:branched-chain amino acid aminotransferase